MLAPDGEVRAVAVNVGRGPPWAIRGLLLGKGRYELLGTKPCAGQAIAGWSLCAPTCGTSVEVPWTQPPQAWIRWRMAGGQARKANQRHALVPTGGTGGWGGGVRYSESRLVFQPMFHTAHLRFG